MHPLISCWKLGIKDSDMQARSVLQRNLEPFCCRSCPRIDTFRDRDHYASQCRYLALHRLEFDHLQWILPCNQCEEPCSELFGSRHSRARREERRMDAVIAFPRPEEVFKLSGPGRHRKHHETKYRHDDCDRDCA